MSGSDSEEGHIRSVWWQEMGRGLGQQTEAGCGCGGSHCIRCDLSIAVLFVFSKLTISSSTPWYNIADFAYC